MSFDDFPGGLVAEAMWWGGGVIIELTANLSSTSHLTSQLELSLAIKTVISMEMRRATFQKKSKKDLDL